jgi:hypothetical protein
MACSGITLPFFYNFGFRGWLVAWMVAKMFYDATSTADVMCRWTVQEAVMTCYKVS